MLDKKIILGGAQFGNSYGIFSRKTKMKSEHEIKKIFNFSIRKKIKYIDTAYDYGNSEKVIGKYSKTKFKIISKIKVSKNIPEKKIEELIKKKVKNSLKRLKVKNLDALLLHNFDNFLENKKNLRKIFHIFLDLKKKKIIKKIGISTYYPEKVHKYYKIFNFKIVQTPFNIFDQRLSQSKIYRLNKFKNIEIHVRSIFLQGVLIKNNYPNFFNKWKVKLDKYFNFIENNNIKALNYCLYFVLSNKRINKIVIGFQNLSQLKEIFINSNRLNFNKKKNIYKDFKSKDLNLIIPSKWKI